jgi:hypothetical protein
VKLTNDSEVLAASVIRATIRHYHDDGGSNRPINVCQLLPDKIADDLPDDGGKNHL